MKVRSEEVLMSNAPRSIFWISLLIVTIGVAGCSQSAKPSKPMNVLLVTLDTVRADHLGSYGMKHDITPNLDRLANEGIRFATAISTAAVTPVSHASILTGRNPYAHGVRVLSADGGFRLDEDIPSLATTLKKVGYRTGAAHSSFTVSSTFGFQNGFDFFDSFETRLHREGAFQTWRVGKNQRRADETTDVAIEFIDAGEQPFLLWVHYWDMHDAFLLPDDAFMPPEHELQRAAHGKIQPNPALYAAEIRFMDHHLGRLLAALEERGLERNTVIAVVADHGEGLGDHDWEFHRLLYQEQIRVPLLLRIPDAHSGLTIDRMVRTTDLFPTLLDYLGLPLPAEIDGRSLRALIEGRDDEPRLAYADQINAFDKNAMMIWKRPKDALLYSVQDNDWKLIYKPLHPERSELYQLSVDPAEGNNLFTIDHPQTRRLLAELARHDGWVLEAPTGEGMTDEARQQLVALGYVDDEKADPRKHIEWSFTPPDEFTERVYDDRGICEKESESSCVPIRLGDTHDWLK